MTPYVLAAEGVNHWRHGSLLLEQINYNFEARRVYGVVGPNGAGKTTLLRLLGLLEKPSQGRIFHKGVDTTACWPNCLALRRQLGFIQQNPVFFQTSVWENIASGLRFRGWPRARIRSRISEILTEYRLAHLTQRPVTSLSGGEAQKVALAQIMVFAPEILLLDEPTAYLDPRNTQEFEELIQGINQHQATTIVLVTHDLGQAERLSQELIFMCRRQIIEVGPTAEVLTSPRQELTQLFLDRKLVL